MNNESFKTNTKFTNIFFVIIRNRGYLMSQFSPAPLFSPFSCGLIFNCNHFLSFRRKTADLQNDQTKTCVLQIHHSHLAKHITVH